MENQENKSSNKNEESVAVQERPVEKVNTPLSKLTHQTLQPKTYTSICELSIRRKNQLAGLPGDDAMMQNPKIGSSFKGNAPLSGLTVEEERVYLPEIIGIAPIDVNWRKEVREYWNNISIRVPHDKEGTNARFPGKPIKFGIVFKSKIDKEAFDKSESFEAKAQISKRGEVASKDISDYVLFRYCLVYSKVANAKKDMFKSAKIEFYLYSQETEAKKQYKSFELRNRARTIFTSLLVDKDKINALLRVFGENPDDSFMFLTEEDKHLKLDELIDKNPNRFINYANDKSLEQKAIIKEAVLVGILHNPPNTDSYYYGDDKQVSLGNSLDNAVLFLKSKEAKNVQVLESIKSQLLYSKS